MNLGLSIINYNCVMCVESVDIAVCWSDTSEMYYFERHEIIITSHMKNTSACRLAIRTSHEDLMLSVVAANQRWKHGCEVAEVYAVCDSKSLASADKPSKRLLLLHGGLT